MSVRDDRLKRFFKAMNSVESDLSLPLLTTLLAVKINPGISVNELSDFIGVPQQTASRYVSVLQGRYQPLGSGENFFAKEPLVEIGISTDDPRKRAIDLTARGNDRVERLLKTIYE